MLFENEEIEIDNKEEFCGEIERIKHSLINCEQLIEGKDIKNKLDKFMNESIKQKYYIEEEYLKLADIILERFKSKIDNHCILKMFLDLSRLHCSVQWLYKSKKMLPNLIYIASENPFDYTDSNQIFIEDLLYTFYYRDIIKNLEKKNYNDIIFLFNKDIYLNSNEGSSVRKTLLRSIISENKYLKNPRNIDILHLL